MDALVKTHRVRSSQSQGLIVQCQGNDRILQLQIPNMARTNYNSVD